MKRMFASNPLSSTFSCHPYFATRTKITGTRQRNSKLSVTVWLRVGIKSKFWISPRPISGLFLKTKSGVQESRRVFSSYTQRRVSSKTRTCWWANVRSFLLSAPAKSKQTRLYFQLVSSHMTTGRNCYHFILCTMFQKCETSHTFPHVNTLDF